MIKNLVLKLQAKMVLLSFYLTEKQQKFLILHCLFQRIDGKQSPAESSTTEDRMRKETHLSVSFMNIVAKILNKILAN